MIPVMQTKFGEGGDCFVACLASLLELPLSDVPRFNEMGSEWHTPFMRFLESKGYEFHGLKYEQEALTYKPGVSGYYIVGGDSPRGLSAGHAVIFHEGKMVHDPHPSGEGVTRVRYAYMIERQTT